MTLAELITRRLNAKRGRQPAYSSEDERRRAANARLRARRNAA